MTSAPIPTQRAEGMLRLGIARLAGQCPFHAALLEQLTLVARPEKVNTMGVTVVGDAVMLYHNPDFVLGITADELGAVLLHEVHHLVFGHVVADPADFPDAWARVAAEEVTANEFVPLPLPGQPITLADFPALPPRESTRERYDRFKQFRRRRPIGPPPVAPGNQGGGAGGGEPDIEECRARNPSPPAVAPPRVEAPGPGERTREAPGSGAGPRSREPRQTVDDHEVWATARQDRDRSEQAIRAVVQDAVRAVGRDRLPDALRNAVATLDIHTDPAGDLERILRGGRGRLNWQQLLRRYVGQALEVRPVFNRPSRRFPELVGILPGRRRQSSRPNILAIIDTSGSITPDLLALIDAELAGLARRFRITVVECDAAIQRVYRYRPLESVQGRGGTNFQPSLERAFLRAQHAELVVYFTDGEGPAPEVPPGPTVIWCLTPGGQAPAPWGRVVTMGGRPGPGPR